MISESNNWDIADQNFGLWLNSDNYLEVLPNTEILKSVYLVFKKNQLNHIANLCHNAFKLFLKKEEWRLKRLQVEEPSAMFSRSEPEPGYWERLTKEQNEVIINGILSGKQRIFNDLYENEFPKVVRLITKNSGNIDSAKDIFQDALVILIEKVNRMELDLTCSIKTYLYSICRILWLKQLRKDKKTISLDDSYDHLESDIVIINYDSVPDIYDDVNNAIENLGDPGKQLLECFYYKKMGWVEIAKTLGYKNAASAKNQKYKYLEQIRNTVSYEIE